MHLKRVISAVVGVASVLALLAVLGSAWWVHAAAGGRTYSLVEDLPYRRVGVVLGCGRQLPDGRGNLFFKYRIEAAVRLFEAHKVDYLVVSGDNHVAGYDEPTDMKNALVSAGVPAERIYCDYAGFRTLDSMVRAKAIFGQTRVTVISQQFHNERAIYLGLHKGIDTIGFNAPEVDAYHSFRTICREQFARVRTLLDVHLFGTGPKFYGPPITIGEVAGPAGSPARS